MSQGEDDKTCPRNLWCCASCLKGRGLCVKEHARAAVTAAVFEGGTRTRGQEKVAPPMLTCVVATGTLRG